MAPLSAMKNRPENRTLGLLRTCAAHAGRFSSLWPAARLSPGIESTRMPGAKHRLRRGLMQTISRFEANLLRLLYFFLRREPPERALPLVEQRVDPPPCLKRGAVRLVQDAFAKGCTHLLAQRGGWRDERHLRGERIAAGRLWERTAPPDLGLSFSRHSLEFLIWITACRPGDDA